MKIFRFKFIKNIYTENRGGISQYLNIYCEHCGDHLLLYQKDGPGPLKRMYFDRIIAPENLIRAIRKKEVPNLVCNSCKRLIGIPSIYYKEKRPAYALLAYTVIKKRGKGMYPPVVLKAASPK